MDGTEHWAGEFEHDSLAAPEARESFTKTMSKYETQDEAVIGGYEAIKMTGKPFKLPESLDKLPDDKTRQEFQAGVSKLIGVIDKEDAIPKDFNWAEGAAEGVQPDENFIGMAKKFAIDNHLTGNQLKGVVNTWNGLAKQARETMEQQAMTDIKATNEALLKQYNGSQEALQADIELMRRTFKNCPGMTAEEYEQIAEDLAGPDGKGQVGAMLRKPVLAKWLLKILAPISKEGDTTQGEGGTKPKKEETAEESVVRETPNTAKALGWV